MLINGGLTSQTKSNITTKGLLYLLLGLSFACISDGESEQSGIEQRLWRLDEHVLLELKATAASIPAAQRGGEHNEKENAE